MLLEDFSTTFDLYTVCIIYILYHFIYIVLYIILYVITKNSNNEAYLTIIKLRPRMILHNHSLQILYNI